LQPTTYLSTRKDERLSRPGWLTYSGRFTNVSGHPSAVGQEQDSESSPVLTNVVDRFRPTFYTPVSRNQPTNIG